MATDGTQGPTEREPATGEVALPATLRQCLGFDTGVRNNIELLDPDTVAFVAGNQLIIEALSSGERRYVHGRAGGGVGCFTVDEGRGLIAVGEKGSSPDVIVLTYPELAVSKVMRGGAEVGYASLHFSMDGEKLASLGMAPDYLLTVWDWRNERVVLRSKAFGQDIYRVRFSLHDAGQLTTAGSGHIRFWRMAATFTGLKLQGDIGKFGKVELSDVAAFLKFPDGKVLSGTESGALLLWEGNLVKCRICRAGGHPAHAREITSILMAQDGGGAQAQPCVITCARDGCLKWWDFAELDAADAGDDADLDACLAPRREVFLGEGCSATAMARFGDRLAIIDESGSIKRVDLPTGAASDLRAIAGGSIRGVAASAEAGVCATVTSGGSLRAWSACDGARVATRDFDVAPSCLEWMPRSADRDQSGVVVGFEDGVLRVMRLAAAGAGEGGALAWQREAVIKPHNAEVTCARYSPDGTLLATTAADSTAFLLRVSEGGSALEPVGFICTPPDPERPGATKRPAPTSICWSANGTRLLVCCGLGGVLEVDLSDAARLRPPSSESFELAHLPTRVFHLKKEVQRQVEPQAPAGPMAEPQEPEFETVLVGGLDAACAAYLPAGQQPEAAADGPRFLLGVRDGASLVYECSFASETALRDVPIGSASRAHGADACFMRFVRNPLGGPEALLIGSTDGGVTLRRADALGAFARFRGHDMHRGAISGAALSFDGALVITAAADGLLLTHDADLERTLQRTLRAHEALCGARDARDGPAGAPEIQPATEPAGQGAAVEAPEGCGGVGPRMKVAAASAEAADITDAGAYSIQDARLKAEEDLRREEAEKKKAQMRSRVREMRDAYAALAQENAAEALAERRLPPESMVVDPEMEALLAAQRRAALREVALESAHDSEKALVLLDKLRDFYLGGIASEAIAVHPMDPAAGLPVRALRVPRLSPETIAALERVRAEGDSREVAELRDLGGGDAALQPRKRQHQRERTSDAKERQGRRAPSLGAEAPRRSAEEQKSTFEVRKELRAERRRQLEALREREPSENADDPRDVAAIKKAQSHMGDFNLKGSPAYVVPENLRVNVENKRQELVRLLERRSRMRVAFNAKVFALRALKQRLLEQLRVRRARVRDIDAALGDGGAGEVPVRTMVPQEFPEWRSRVSEAARRSFQAQRAQGRAFGDVAPPEASADGEELAGVAPISRVAEGADGSGAAPATAPPSAAPMLFVTGDGAPEELDIASALPCMALVAPPEDCDATLQAARRTALVAERAQLLELSAAVHREFDAMVYGLRQEQMRTAIALKDIELRQLLMLQELRLLKEFRVRDAALSNRLERCEREQGEILASVGECRDRLGGKQGELEASRERGAAIHGQFGALVSEASPSHGQLLRIFRRRIKRNRGGGDEDDEDFDSDEDFDEEDLDSEEDEDVEDACPPGCDVALYEKVLELRERRLDQEEVTGDIQKSIDELRRTMERSNQRQKQVDKDLEATRKEIRAFQATKVGRLNLLQAFVPLRASQLHSWETDEVSGESLGVAQLSEHAELGRYVVFNRARLEKLHARIAELEDENAAEMANFRELHKTKRRLQKDKNVKDAKIERERARCRELQLLKFGDEIDLEQLDKVAGTGIDDEMNARVTALERDQRADVRTLEAKLRQAKDRLLGSTTENTELLQQVGQLSARHFQLERELNAGASSVSVGDRGPTVKKEADERNRLVALVRLQAREVDALKAEIGLLRRKSAPVHSRAQPRVPESNEAAAVAVRLPAAR